MIYAVITLAVLVLILYVCGCFLMRAFLKTAESTDKDKLYPGALLALDYDFCRWRRYDFRQI